MRHLLRAFTFAALSIVFVFSLSMSAVAQYGDPVGDLGAYITEARTSTERPEGALRFVIPGTLRVTTNLLRAQNGDPLAEGVYRQLDLAEDQRFLVVYGRLPVIRGTLAIFALEGADNNVVIRVAPRGGIYARLPIQDIPSGSYYVTLNGVRIAIVNAP